jgi:hypothetical protein
MPQKQAGIHEFSPLFRNILFSLTIPYFLFVITTESLSLSPEPKSITNENIITS